MIYLCIAYYDKDIYKFFFSDNINNIATHVQKQTDAACDHAWDSHTTMVFEGYLVGHAWDVPCMDVHP